jgi:hypothetical protein
VTVVDCFQKKKKQVSKPSDGLLHVSELNRRMQEILGHYILLEEHFMVESVKKVRKKKE